MYILGNSGGLDRWECTVFPGQGMVCQITDRPVGVG